ncbi:RHS repeat-associated core domain-containing protein [Pseudomonas tremae]|nr:MULTISPECIES: RHS repeat-associated core domain-containing protein [Pseudomonas syringae group]
MNETPESSRILCRYRYDALDRIAVVDPGVKAAVSRFYQKNRLTVEIQGAVHRRVFHSQGHLLAEYKTGGTSARLELLGTDLQSTVLQAVSSQGQHSLAYSPYGHRLQSSPMSGFNGERPDPVTGHYLLGNGYRAFNPVLMRFNSPDSLSPFGRGGMNAYAYCQGDPVNRSDPDGHAPRLAGFYFHKLPNEMFSQVIKHLPPSDLVSLSKTSRTMREKIYGLLNIPKIDTDDPSALLTIQRNLQSGTGVPGNNALYKEHVRAHIGDVAKRTDLNLSAHVARVDNDVQVFLDSVTMRPRATYNDFKAKVDGDRKLYAKNPDILENIDWAVNELAGLNKKLNSLTLERRGMQQLATRIRSQL